MTENDRKLIFETSIAVAALVDILADGEGLASLNDFRDQFRRRFIPLLSEASRERTAHQSKEVQP